MLNTKNELHILQIPKIEVKMLTRTYIIKATTIAELYYKLSKKLKLNINQFTLIYKNKNLAIRYPLDSKIKIMTVYFLRNFSCCPLRSLANCKLNISIYTERGVKKVMSGKDCSKYQNKIKKNWKRYNKIYKLYYNDDEFVNDEDPITLGPFDGPSFPFVEGGKKYRMLFTSITEYVKEFYDGYNLLNPYTRGIIPEPFKSDFLAMR